MDKTSPMKSKPLVDVTCKLGIKGCFEDGRCHALGNCENKIVTNADRIRAMSDEELVKNFWEVMDDSKFCTGVCNEQRDCNVCRLAWLKQPVEEGKK